jgi:hypothetical protein
MRVKRKTQAVVNEPLSVLNVQRLIVLLVILLSLAVGKIVGWPYGLAGFLAAFLAAAGLQKMDQDIWALIPCIWRFQMDRGYDPLEREPDKLIVSGEDYEEED